MSETQADPWAAFPAVAEPTTGSASSDPWAAFPVVAEPRQRIAVPDALRSFAHGLGDMGYGAAQTASHALPSVAEIPLVRRIGDALGMGSPRTPQRMDELVAERERNYLAGRVGTGTDWARGAGMAVAALPIAMLAAPASMVGAAATGAGIGGLMALAEPVTNGQDFGGEKTRQVMGGAGVGAVTGPLGYVAGRLIAPSVPQAVRDLRGAGVELTPGQIAGGSARRFEDAATSLPLAGERIIEAQRNAMESFNRAAANRVLAPLGEKVGSDAPAGRALVGDVSQRVSRAYDDAIKQAQPFGPDQQFAQDIAATAQRFLTPESGRAFMARFQNDVVSRMQSGQITPEVYQTVRSELGRLARTYSGSSTAAERELGAAYGAAREAFDGLAERANPHIAPQLRAANQAYAQLVRFEQAAGMQGAVEGVFSPAQLSAAVRSGDSSVRHRAFARGDALMQDLSDAGRRALPSTVNDSGTATRSQLLNPFAWAAGSVLSQAYRPNVRNAATWIMAHNAPGPVGLLGDTVAQSGGAVAVPLGSLLISPPENRPQ